jgi:hypothetical protein
VGTDAATLLAVVIGALLATVGGFAATRLEDLMTRRERERSAALLFGEILSVLDVIFALADEARGRGEPYGQFTMRLLRTARRETEAYDRNRELLYDLRDPLLRAQIHTLMVRVTLPLEGVFDAADAIAAAESDLRALDGPASAEALARLAALTEARHGAFDAIIETMAQTAPVLAALKPLARQSFEAYASVVRGG